MSEKGSSDSSLIIWGAIAIVVVFALVYGIAKVIDVVTKPSIVWWVIGFASCLVLEGLVLLIIYITRHWNDLFNNVRQWFRDTF